MRSQAMAESTAAHLHDADIVRRIGNGERGALQIAMSNNIDRVYAIARRVVGNDAEAEDVAQDVFIKLWNAPPELEQSGARLSTWLYRVTTNRCLDMLRRTRPDQLDDDVEHIDDTPGPEDDVSRAQVARTVDEALNALPPRQRIALALTYYEGFSNREVADLLDTGVEAVESLLARARRNLKRALKPKWRELLDALAPPSMRPQTYRRGDP